MYSRTYFFYFIFKPDNKNNINQEPKIIRLLAFFGAI